MKTHFSPQEFNVGFVSRFNISYYEFLESHYPLLQRVSNCAKVFMEIGGEIPNDSDGSIKACVKYLRIAGRHPEGSEPMQKHMVLLSRNLPGLALALHSLSEFAGAPQQMLLRATQIFPEKFLGNAPPFNEDSSRFYYEGLQADCELRQNIANCAVAFIAYRMDLESDPIGPGKKCIKSLRRVGQDLQDSTVAVKGMKSVKRNMSGLAAALNSLYEFSRVPEEKIRETIQIFPHHFHKDDAPFMDVFKNTYFETLSSNRELLQRVSNCAFAFKKEKGDVPDQPDEFERVNMCRLCIKHLRRAGNYAPDSFFVQRELNSISENLPGLASALNCLSLFSKTFDGNQIKRSIKIDKPKKEITWR